MAAVTGPISSLPGSSHKLPAGSTCDEHDDRPAVARIQGETDSFGSEMIDMCQECFDKHNEYIEAERRSRAVVPTHCEWHKGPGLNVSPMRDHDEGMHGRLYDVCSDCRAKVNARLQEELEYSQRYY